MVKIEYARRGRRHTLHIRGHAGYAEPGKDIVCAGVTAIVYALIGYLDKHETFDCDIREGYVGITCEGSREIDTAFGMAVEGYHQIAAMYPENVRMIEPR